MQNPGLSIDSLLGVTERTGGNLAVDVGVDIGIRNLVLALQVMFVHPHDGCADTSLVVLFHSSRDVPAFQLGLSEEKLNLSRVHEGTGTVGHLEVDAQEGTDHACVEVVLVETNLRVLGNESLQRGNLAVSGGVHPVTPPGSTRHAGGVGAGTLQIGHHLVSHVNIPVTVGLHLGTLSVDVVAADAIETRVVIVFQNIIER